MPVFADVLPEPSIWYPYGSANVYHSLGYSILKTWWIFMLIILSAFLAYWIVCLWKIFKKAWLPGRWSLIPFYRECLRFRMVGRNERWTASLLCWPMFAIILIISYFKTAEKFGKDKEQFGIWLWLLHPIFLWILAFDKSKYQSKK